MSEFDIGNLWQWVLLGNAVGTFALSILVMYLGTKFTKRSEHAALSSRVDAVEKQSATIENRLTRGDMQFQYLEKTIAALPTREHLGEIKQLVTEVAGHARVVEEQGKHSRELFRLLDNKATMIETFLRELTQSGSDK